MNRTKTRRAQEVKDAAIERQNAEFDALDTLAKRWHALQKVAVVDDDYPQERNKYEQALKEFIEALQANNRIPTLDPGPIVNARPEAMTFERFCHQNNVTPRERREVLAFLIARRITNLLGDEA